MVGSTPNQRVLLATAIRTVLNQAGHQMNQLAEEVRAPHATSRLTEHLSRRYLASFLILPVLALVFPFVAERAKPLQNLSASYFCRLLDYDYETAGENADIVLFGIRLPVWHRHRETFQ